MRAFTAFTWLCLCAIPTLAQEKPLADSERAALTGHLERTLGIFDAAVAGVGDAQAKFKPAPDRWSILEIAEHIAVIEDFLFGYATQQVLRSPAKPELAERTAAELEAADAKIMTGVVDRTKPSQAPEQAKPTGRYVSVAAASEALHARRAKVLEYVRTTQDGLRAHGSAMAGGRMMDVYQLLLILAGHTERHVLQMNEVKAAAGYPAR